MFLYLLAILAIFLFFRAFLRTLKIKSYKSKHVFITGCDTGFGNMLTKRLDGLGFYVFAGCLTESGETGLRKCCSQNLLTVKLDVTQESSIQKALEFVKSKLPKDKGLWAIVNNAGIAGRGGPSEWLPREVYDKVMAVNLYGVIDVTRAFLPLIRKTPGRIVNIASIMGRYAGVGAPYSISKYGVEAYSDTIRKELYRTGVTVHILEPGYFATDLLPTQEELRHDLDMLFNGADEEVRDYYGVEYKEHLIKTVNQSLKELPSKDTYKVVDAYVHAITARYPKARYVVGRDANTIFKLLINLPEWASDAIATRNQILPAGCR